MKSVVASAQRDRRAVHATRAAGSATTTATLRTLASDLIARSL